ncbi:hypothetical protein HFO06_28710 [Rhizobium leguminosarum]|uniref:hypothetical protein n=1 Tax=Rhizobium leguminosarum TaxID=384 RepID=UPI001C9407DE|nr:hypothetical protein [Rhizobium leguminosarum]MBY5767033.1 hypothetical protein [Rhizobium leguminosarum]
MKDINDNLPALEDGLFRSEGEMALILSDISRYESEGNQAMLKAARKNKDIQQTSIDNWQRDVDRALRRRAEIEPLLAGR